MSQINELQKLAQLKADGTISEEEFVKLKAELLLSNTESEESLAASEADDKENVEPQEQSEFSKAFFNSVEQQESFKADMKVVFSKRNVFILIGIVLVLAALYAKEIKTLLGFKTEATETASTSSSSDLPTTLRGICKEVGKCERTCEDIFGRNGTMADAPKLEKCSGSCRRSGRRLSGLSWSDLVYQCNKAGFWSSY